MSKAEELAAVVTRATKVIEELDSCATEFHGVASDTRTAEEKLDGVPHELSPDVRRCLVECGNMFKHCAGTAAVSVRVVSLEAGFNSPVTKWAADRAKAFIS